MVMGAAQYDGVPVSRPGLPARRGRDPLAPALRLHHHGHRLEGARRPVHRGAGVRAVPGGRRHPGRDILEAGGSNSWENLSDAAPTLLARGDRTVLMVTDPFHEARSLAIASSVGLVPTRRPTRTSPIKGFSTFPYFAKETVGMALGRIIGFNRLSRSMRRWDDRGRYRERTPSRCPNQPGTWAGTVR